VKYETSVIQPQKDELGKNVKRGKYQCGENEMPGRAESEVQESIEERNDWKTR